MGQVDAPFDHVDFFAGQFVDDILDAQPAQPYTAADGIQSGHSGLYGDFAAVSGLARDRFDFDLAVAHLRNLLFHQAAQQIAVGA